MMQCPVNIENYLCHSRGICYADGQHALLGVSTFEPLNSLQTLQSVIYCFRIFIGFQMRVWDEIIKIIGLVAMLFEIQTKPRKMRRAAS